ncbi:MAG: DUF116 domain-containing protein [Desulfonauticus sp.]|nr:DUF116 domain-containing protein [Desulfonauticus sp.]
MNDDYLKLHQEIQDDVPAKKRLFIGLITLTSFLVCIFLFLLWLIPYVGLKNIHPVAPYVLGAIVFLLIGLTIWASLELVFNIVWKRNLLFTQNIRGLTIKFFLPLMVAVGKIFGISQQKVKTSFIKVNNELVLNQHPQYPAQEILLLLPHCLQNSTCSKRLTYNIYNCQLCGRCPIADLIKLHQQFKVKLAIATGGTIARRIVVQTKPKLIVAVACERDLVSGIQDTYPIPVYGILNQRPKGPCLDTLVPIDQVKKVLEIFVAKHRIKTTSN